ncbi:MAG: helix-turn-helix transcriptional regulator [Actinobacteria bacterium]|nr:helix-turn-helix transcriptional regulator [Actinomycetota bacterium]
MVGLPLVQLLQSLRSTTRERKMPSISRTQPKSVNTVLVQSNRTRTALLDGARLVLSEVGVREANMITIADRSRVARATLYNHFRDKEEILHALLDSEIARMSELAKSASNRSEVLFLLSRDIFDNGVLRKVAELEPHLIARMVTISESEKWGQVRETLQSVLYCSRESGELVLRWLLSQFFSPVPESARRGAVEKVEASLSL